MLLHSSVGVRLERDAAANLPLNVYDRARPHDRSQDKEMSCTVSMTSCAA